MKLPEEIPAALDVFEKLLSVASPSGNEKKMSGFVAGLIDEMGWKAEIDAADQQVAVARRHQIGRAHV